LKGKIKTWDVFPDDMGMDNSVELAMANLDLNESVLEPVTFDDGDTIKGSSSTPANAEIVDFYSIGCDLTLRFYREAKTHPFSKTQKSLGKIPPRDGFIKIINHF